MVMVVGVISEIRITGLGVIDDATLPFAPGFTAVTGETGAGKTMVVAGLGLLFGGKADAGRVRGGQNRAIVEGRVAVTSPSLRERLTELGAELEDDGTVIIARTVMSEGRSRAHAGGRAVPASVLGELGDELVAMHGQSDQLRLLHPGVQRGALDRFGGGETQRLLNEYRRIYSDMRDVLSELQQLTEYARERAREADTLRYGVGEIDAADPQPHEEKQLLAEAQRLEHADQLRGAAFAAHQALAGDPAAVDGTDASNLLGTARRVLEEVAPHDDRLRSFAERADELTALAGELAADLASYEQVIEADPVRLSVVQERRAVLANLIRKYGDDLAEVRAWADRAREKLSHLDSSEERLAFLRERRDVLIPQLASAAAQLSEERARVAQRFGEAVSVELAGLAMPDAMVRAVVTHPPARDGHLAVELDGERVAAGPDGVDDVELQLIAHPGAPARALQRGASGGELSRVMLAVEVVFAGSTGVATMVFDEVDAGVGGKAAVEVGRRLARLARDHQVLVVTHLPQVAAFADQHLLVVKDSAGAVTTSGVHMLTEAERPKELARMLAGIDDSEIGIAHAEELLELARRSNVDNQ